MDISKYWYQFGLLSLTILSLLIRYSLKMLWVSVSSNNLNLSDRENLRVPSKECFPKLYHKPYMQCGKKA